MSWRRAEATRDCARMRPDTCSRAASVLSPSGSRPTIRDEAHVLPPAAGRRRSLAGSGALEAPHRRLDETEGLLRWGEYLVRVLQAEGREIHQHVMFVRHRDADFLNI